MMILQRCVLSDFLSICTLWMIQNSFGQVANQCGAAWQCQPQQGIIIGRFNLSGNYCREFSNNSIISMPEDNLTEIIDSRCGIRCARSSAPDIQMSMRWEKPRPGISNLNTVDRGSYSDLVRLSNLNNNNINGVYSCILGNSVDDVLHLGIYLSKPAQPLVANLTVDKYSSYILLKCDTTNSPPTNVTWMKDGVSIQPSDDYIMEQYLIDRRSAKYESTLRINAKMLTSGVFNCSVVNVLGRDNAHVNLSVMLPTPTELRVDVSTLKLSWTLQNSSMLQDHQIYLPIRSYIVEVTGGNCPSNESIHELEVTQHNNNETSLLLGLQLHSGANYSLRLKALNDHVNITSNFSEAVNFNTLPKVPSEAPRSFEVVESKIVSIVLSWQEVECSERNGVITHYLVQRSRNDRTINKTVHSESSVEISGLCPFLKYSFKVAAENSEGPGPFAKFEARILTERMITIIGATTASICVFLCVLFSCMCYCYCMKKRKKKRTEINPGLLDEGANHDDFEMGDMTDNVSIQLQVFEPVIEVFPDNIMLACLGEYVIMYVSVHGNPPPTLTWYHNNENIIYNNSTIEISEDGTLSIPSMEARHVGEYKLVATNEHGSCESEMELYLESEDTPNLFRALSMSLLIDTAPVPVSSLEEYVASHHSKSNDAFRCEFLSLNSENSGATTIGEMPQNRALNRFKHIVPYDDNRVVLRPISGFDDCQHDYINASYVDGQNLRNAFIAAQGPLPHTMTDFWRMVWQERVKLIVMLCNTVEGHRVRCQQYWPSSGSQNYGPFRIKLETEHKYSDYILRTFEIKFSATTDDPKLIEHYQFTSWPDNLLPENSSSILAMHNKALSNLSLEGPILVHCSAGVGRTGAFIAMDRALEQTKEGVVDVMGIVNDMRQQRMKMVQTLAQYIDIYDSVLKHVVCGETKIDAVDLRVALKTLRTVDQNTGQTELEKQFQVLQKITPSPLEVDRNVTAKNRDMNRSMEFLPRDTKRVVLYGGGGDYIHATFVDGYKQKKAFIVTQGPQEDTCNDFWKMIHQYNCGTIVMLSDLLEYNREVCYPYWPKAGSEDYSDYNVEFMKESNEESLNMREFLVTCTSKENKNEKAHPVTQFQVLNWMPDGQCSNFVTITRLLEEVTRNQIKTGNHPIVVHCSDTVGRSAIFCAALSAIEQCKTEVAIDIFHVVKGIRMQKPGAVVSVEQYSLIFDVVLTYLDSIDNYANFQC